MGSKLVGIDPYAYRSMSQQEKSKLARHGIELIEQDAKDVPDNLKQGYDVLVLKGFRKDVVGARIERDLTVTEIIPFFPLKNYVTHLRPGGYVVDCDGFDRELRKLGLKPVEIKSPYNKAFETFLPLGAIGGQATPAHDFRIYQKPRVKVLQD